MDYCFKLNRISLFVHMDHTGLLRREIKRKRCHVLVSNYWNYTYIHPIEYLYEQPFLKTRTLEIKKHIEKAKIGDQIAFTFLLDFYWNEVYGFMLKRTENETDAEDITIETFSKAFDKIATYNDEFQFNTWLIAIAKNVHIDLLRKK